MEAVVEKPIQISANGKHSPTGKHIRGSGLLLFGKVFSVGLTFMSQVLIVRYLTTQDYGAFAYALSIVAFFQHLSTLGLRVGVPRFVPIYHEREQYEKLLGTIVLTLGTAILTSLLIIGVIYIAPEQMARLINDEQQPVVLLLIIIFLIPVEALDDLMVGLFASFASSRTIFFRRYILGPCLKLAVVLSMVLLQASVVFLAYGYVIASIVGLLVYLTVLFTLLRRRGILQRVKLKNLELPARELFGFSLPLLTTDLLVGVAPFVTTLFLGYYHDSKEVAFFRAVLPIANLNRIVRMSFEMLYAPGVARLFAKNDYAGINELYWRNAIWVAVLSFPLFVFTFSTAEPFVTAFYGQRYEQTWVILAVLAFAQYFNCAFGFKAVTLQVVGKLRFVITTNVLAAMFSVGINFLLIPRYGALGAAWGTALTMVLHSIVKQAGLRLIEGVAFFEKKYLSFYLLLAASAFGLFIFQILTSSSIYVALPLAALVALLVLHAGKKILNIEETFPEINKFPFIKRLLI